MAAVHDGHPYHGNRKSNIGGSTASAITSRSASFFAFAGSNRGAPAELASRTNASRHFVLAVRESQEACVYPIGDVVFHLMRNLEKQLRLLNGPPDSRARASR